MSRSKSAQQTPTAPSANPTFCLDSLLQPPQPGMKGNLCLLKAQTSTFPGSNFSLDVVRSLAAQLVQAVSFMHSEGIVHGDIRINNALVHFSPPSSSIDNLSVAELYAQHGTPVPGSDDGVDDWTPQSQEFLYPYQSKPPTPIPPPHGIGPIRLSIPAGQLTLTQARIVLGDFKSSFDQINEIRYKSHGPLKLKPPDLFFPPFAPLNFDSDIWSLGATIFELLASRPLIDVGNFTLSNEDHDRLQEEKGQEPTPEEWDEEEMQMLEEELGRTDANGRRLTPTAWQNEFTGQYERMGRPRSAYAAWDWRYGGGLQDLDDIEGRLHHFVWE
ncbi:Protein kinase-like domain containing protein [Naviculisporaceae sp. PSN 640]